MRYTRNNMPGGCPACGRGMRNAGSCQHNHSGHSAEACPAEPVSCPAAAEECTILPVMAFLQTQIWDCTYTCGQALARGTLFPALDKPFMGKGGCCNG